MSEPSALLRALSEEAVWRLEEACCRFEEAWQAGRRPRLEDFVAGPEGEERLALLRELLRLEVYYRRRAGEGPSAADYQTRFPEDTAVLQEVFASPPGPGGPPAPRDREGRTSSGRARGCCPRPRRRGTRASTAARPSGGTQALRPPAATGD
jgi:hypothetical protein